WSSLRLSALLRSGLREPAGNADAPCLGASAKDQDETPRKPGHLLCIPRKTEANAPAHLSPPAGTGRDGTGILQCLDDAMARAESASFERAEVMNNGKPLGQSW